MNIAVAPTCTDQYSNQMKKNNAIPPLPAIPEKVTLSDDHQTRVRELAEKGFSPSRIVRILGLSRLEQQLLLIRIDTPGDVYQEAYTGGVLARQEGLLDKLKEKALTGDPDAVKAFQDYKNALRESELRYKLFGV